MRKYLLFFSALISTIQGLFAKEKPNFLFIITDDQTFESINSLNNKEVKTPNFDRLVKDGTTFTHCFNQGSWTGAISVASRTMLITGQNVFKAQENSAYIDGWARTIPIEKSKRVKVWGEVMKEAGYETFITGKWHNTDEPLLKSFTKGTAIAQGFYETYDSEGKKDFGYNRPNDKKWVPYDENFKGHWSPKVRDIIYEDGEKKVTRSYLIEKHTSEIFADKAVEFLQEEQAKPFFMYVAFNAPHDPRQSPKDIVEEYPVEKIKIPKNFLPEHPIDIDVKNERDEVLSTYPRTKEGIQLHRSEYYAIISHLDREVGRILDALEASGYKENTYIVFTSDQGLAVGMHGLMGKQNLYDHSIRMPFIITGPNIKKGHKIHDMIYMQSIYPTTCELAGIPVPETVDFKSLCPLLYGEKDQGEEYIFGAFRNAHRMIRSNRYKLIIYPKVNEVQLFDIKKDPYETKNLANNPKYQDVKNQLFEKLKEKQQELKDTLEIKI